MMLIMITMSREKKTELFLSRNISTEAKILSHLDELCDQFSPIDVTMLSYH